MSWSRIDSGFWRHPKFTGWTAAQKWALGELIGYCCEFRTDGHVPDDLSLLPRSITKGFLVLAVDAGWLDMEDDGLRFHDWNDYHPKDPTSAMRMQKLRKKRAVTLPSLDRHETVTTNTSTNKPKAFDRKGGETGERTGRLRDAETDQDGPVGGASEGHGSVFRLERVEPEGHREANVSELRSVVQELFGPR